MLIGLVKPRDGRRQSEKCDRIVASCAPRERGYARSQIFADPHEWDPWHNSAKEQFFVAVIREYCSYFR